MPAKTRPLNTRLPLTPERLWQFSLQYYAVKGIKEACLSLQNEFSGNVNFMILLKWLDEAKLTFDPVDWPLLFESLQRSDALLKTFRELRRKSKRQVPSSIYQESLQFELQLEREQQKDLLIQLNQLLLVPQHDKLLTTQYCEQLKANKLITIFSVTHF
jgi:uncharacterized protein (TIGR02444 family)